MPVPTPILLVAASAVVTIAGIVWTLQGLGYVGGSFMTGAAVWAVIGPVTAVAGLALIAFGLLRRRAPGGRA